MRKAESRSSVRSSLVCHMKLIKNGLLTQDCTVSGEVVFRRRLDACKRSLEHFGVDLHLSVTLVKVIRHNWTSLESEYDVNSCDASTKSLDFFIIKSTWASFVDVKHESISVIHFVPCWIQRVSSKKKEKHVLEVKNDFFLCQVFAGGSVGLSREKNVVNGSRQLQLINTFTVHIAVAFFVDDMSDRFVR